MAEIYQMMVDKKDVGELYYDFDDVMRDAAYASSDDGAYNGKIVHVFYATERDGVPVDCLDWDLLASYESGDEI